MTNNICTNWQDVREWIEDNKLQRYTFRAEKQTDGTRSNSVVFAYDTQDTPEENLRLCEKRLQAASGTHLWGTGFRSAQANTGGIVCEVQYNGYAGQQPVYGIGSGCQGVDEEAIANRIRKELRQEMELEELKKREKEIELREKEYEAEKQSVIGGIMSYLAPYIPQLLGQTRLSHVAGAGAPVSAERIVPTEPKPETECEQEAEAVDPNDLPDEEAQRAYELLKRFKKVEPDYLTLLENVVVMAENGDATYNMARGFLINK